MKTKKVSFKKFHPLYSFFVACFSGLIVFMLSLMIVPLCKEFLDILNEGGIMGGNAYRSVLNISFYGFIAYLFSIVFQLCHKSLIDHFYLE